MQINFSDKIKKKECNKICIKNISNGYILTEVVIY